MAQYEIPRPPRFIRESVPGGYQFVIPALKNWFVLPGMIFWLVMWSYAGVLLLLDIGEWPVFLYFWAIFWAVAWSYGAAQLIYMINGKEIIRYASGDISIEYRSFMLGKTWTYQGLEIKKLTPTDGPNFIALGLSFRNWSNPIFAARRIGAIRFNYGARTIYAGNCLNRAEAELIVADLLRSLPNAG